ncbi:MAG: hypothetical protein ACO3TW_08805 [Ilumatobacteraceae bacterium]
MAWMRNSTPEETVFASNNESFLLSALSHRRGLLQAEEYVRQPLTCSVSKTSV